MRSVSPSKKGGVASVPSCRVLAVHARSASFARHKGVLDYSQPFVDGRHAFVFNGLLFRGVSFPARDDRAIGSQRIWDLSAPWRMGPPRPTLNTGPSGEPGKAGRDPRTPEPRSGRP